MSALYDTVRSRPVATWSVLDVQTFLEHLELPNLKPIFSKNGVNGRDLQAFSKQELKEELGCTELQARKIVEAVSALSQVSPGERQPQPGRTTTTTTTTTTTAAYAPVMHGVAPAPCVVYNGYAYQPRERYIGGITVLIAVLFCFPCIFCCPVDERNAQVTVAMAPVTNPPTTSPPPSQTMS